MSFPIRPALVRAGRVAAAALLATLALRSGSTRAGPAWPATEGGAGRPVLLRGATIDIAAEVARRGRSFAPRVAAPDLAGAAFASGPVDLFIVQWAHSVSDSEPRRLRAVGGEALGYLPHDALLCRLDAEARTALLGSRDVTWVGHFAPALRVDPPLLRPFADLELDVVLARGADASAALKAWTAAGLSPRHLGSTARGGLVRVRASRAALPVLAARPEVTWIELRSPPRLLNAVARSSGDVPGARGGVPGPFLDVERSWQAGLRGKGQVVAVADSGLDVGRFEAGAGQPALHADFGEPGNPANPLRVLRVFAPSDFVPDLGDDWSDTFSHGTQAAGSAVGNGALSGSDPSALVYDGSQAGMAPRAGLVVQKIWDSAGAGVVGGSAAWADAVFGWAHDAGARVHSNSWGENGNLGAYTLNTRDVDALAWEHPDLSILFAAGNAGSDGAAFAFDEGWTPGGCGPSTWTLAGAVRDEGACPMTALFPGLPFWAVNPEACAQRYAPNTDSCLLFGPVEVDPALAPVELELWHQLELPEPVGDGDVARLELDRDDDGTFETLVAEWRDSTAASVSMERFSLTPDAWGTQARLRLRFSSDGSNQGWGWNVHALSLRDGRIDRNSLGPPATAKNILAVGASESYQPDVTVDERTRGDCARSPISGPVEPLASDHPANAPEGMAAFSARGPTDDGRVKPDIVAPGTYNLTTRSRAAAPPPSNDCGVPAGIIGDYNWFGGTSGAAPLVAGIAALTRQSFAEGWYAKGHAGPLEAPDAFLGFEPSAALVKAMLLGGAHPMAPGQYEPPFAEIPEAVPNVVCGFGRVDAHGTLFPHEGADFGPSRRTIVHESSDGLVTGESVRFEFEVVEASEDLRLTLAWTDPPATLAAGRALVNDLDLTLELSDGRTLRPGGEIDRLNNVEHLRVAAGELPLGLHHAVVTATNVPGQPALPGSTRQPHALVVSGALRPCTAPPAVTDTLRVTADRARGAVVLAWDSPAGEPASHSHRVHSLEPDAAFESRLVLAAPREARFEHGSELDREGDVFYRVASVSDCGAQSERIGRSSFSDSSARWRRIAPPRPSP